MKIKALAAALMLFSMTAVTRMHALGLGAQLNFSAGQVFAPGAALVISPSDMTHLALNWYLAEEVNIIGLTVDVCPLTLPITTFGESVLNFTLGGGVFVNMVLADEFGFNGGLRIPVGFNVMIGKVFEVYTHVAPSFGLDLLPSIQLSSPFYPVALGARFWFR